MKTNLGKQRISEVTSPVSVSAPWRQSDPKILNLPVSANGNVGQQMVREAVQRVVLMKKHGWPPDDLADFFDHLKRQIEAADRSWKADRSLCADGTHCFAGPYGDAIVFCPDGAILRGQVRTGCMLDPLKMVQSPQGRFMLPAPNRNARDVRPVA